MFISFFKLLRRLQISTTSYKYLHISININPVHRGRNFAKECLVISIKFFLKKYPEIKKLVAEVNEENIASKKIFLGTNFLKYKVTNGFGYYQKML